MIIVKNREYLPSKIKVTLYIIALIFRFVKRHIKQKYDPFLGYNS